MTQKKQPQSIIQQNKDKAKETQVANEAFWNETQKVVYGVFTSFSNSSISFPIDSNDKNITKDFQDFC